MNHTTGCNGEGRESIIDATKTLAGNDIFLSRSALFTNRIERQGQHQDHENLAPSFGLENYFLPTS
jgi:hypothetical protein